MDEPEGYDDIFTPLFHAVQAVNEQDLFRLRDLIDQHPDLVHEVDDEVLNWTLLHHAAAAGFLDAIRLLVERGADVNAHVARLSGDTSLDVAITRHRFEAGLLLLEFGANPNFPAWMWITALDRVVDELGQVPATLKEPFVTRCIEAAHRFPPPEYPDGTTPQFWPREPGGPQPKRV